MFCKVESAVIHGMEVRGVTVEVNVSDGLPAFEMIGMLAGEVKDITTISLIQSNDRKVPSYRLFIPKIRGISRFQVFNSQTKKK
ncbi:MAG: hypothetical protein E7269_08540, partial [Lachnospiraceae bacterium]|nr:hypothetical protein [Lachnospiraceae bacterium]